MNSIILQTLKKSPQDTIFDNQNNIIPIANSFQQKYDVKVYSITSFTLAQVVSSYDRILKKIFLNTANSDNIRWQQGEKRLFTWYVMIYCYQNQKEVQSLGVWDYQKFNIVFTGKQNIIFQHHCLEISKRQSRLPWVMEQNDILHDLIKNFPKKWNQISKLLFIRSDKKYFRTGKQCRQRYQNHIDQSKHKGKWTHQQDYKLLKFVDLIGKKWAAISKKMGGVRTQHMVKNRYLSLKNREVYGDITNSENIKIILQEMTNNFKENKIKIQESQYQFSEESQQKIKLQEIQCSNSIERNFLQNQSGPKSVSLLNQLQSNFFSQIKINPEVNFYQRNFMNNQMIEDPILCFYFPNSGILQAIQTQLNILEALNQQNNRNINNDSLFLNQKNQ